MLFRSGFFNKFADMARFSPVLPLIGGGETKFQPVFVGDVARAFSEVVNSDRFDGKTLELGGPEIFSFRQLLEYVLQITERKRILMPIPWFAARAMGSVFGRLPYSLITRDQVAMLETDNVVSGRAQKDSRTLEGMGIKPETIAAHVPSYLFRYKKFGQFTESGNSSI